MISGLVIQNKSFCHFLIYKYEWNDTIDSSYGTDILWIIRNEIRGREDKIADGLKLSWIVALTIYFSQLG